MPDTSVCCLHYYSIAAFLLLEHKQTESLLLEMTHKNSTQIASIQTITLRSKTVSLFLGSSKGLFHIFPAGHRAFEGKLLIPWQA